MAAPASHREPYVLDMATTTVAVGKLSIAVRWDKPIPEGWGLDEHAKPTTDARKVLASRLLSPLGGSRELGGHKGYGLGVLVDILSGVLGGAVYGDVLDRKGLRGQKLTNTGHCFAAIDIKRFRPIEDFTADMDDLLGTLQDMPTAEGHERVLTAGQPEAETEPIAGLVDALADEQLRAGLEAKRAEGDAALEELERAIDHADEKGRAAEAALVEKKDEPEPEPQGGPQGPGPAPGAA